MDELRIDKLTLRLPGWTEEEGRRLALLITAGLSTAELAPSSRTHAEALRLLLKAHPEDSVEVLSKQVVAEVLAQLAR